MKKIKNIKSKLIMILLLAISICMFSITSMAETSENTQKLTEEELTTFTNILNKKENNGFLQSTYSKAKEINLNKVFYNLGSEKIEEEEKQDVIDLFKIESFEIPVFKLTEEKVMDTYELKTGEKITNSDIEQRLSEWKYSEKYNAYYKMHGDTSLNEVKCISGEKDSNGIYKIVYQAMDNNIKLYAIENGKKDLTSNIDKMVVTLQKKGDNYIFVSNNIYTSDIPDTSDKTEDKTEKQQNENKIQLQNENINKDNSIAAKELPKTGVNSIIFVVIILAIVLGLVWIIKWNKYRNIK